jgi:hypothetical protein
LSSMFDLSGVKISPREISGGLKVQSDFRAVW